MKLALIKEFRSLVNKKSGVFNLVDGKRSECWVWIITKYRYGRFKKIGAHRVAWELKYGPIPEGKLICHKCDNPACVRPSHLFIGTHKDNTEDMVTKGRHGLQNHPERAARGDRSGARLHPERRPWGDRNGSRKHPERLPRGADHWRHKN